LKETISDDPAMLTRFEEIRSFRDYKPSKPLSAVGKVENSVPGKGVSSACCVHALYAYFGKPVLIIGGKDQVAFTPA